jgi:integrase
VADRKKRSVRGGGSVSKSGNNWRLRYWIGGTRHSKTVKGTKLDATRELRRLLDGTNVDPSKMTLSQWKREWLTVRERSLKARTYERYDDILTRYIEPHLGTKQLQRITPVDIDRAYGKLKVAPSTAELIHVVLKSCLQAAVKKKLVATNPCDDAEKPGGEIKPDNDAESEVDGATLARLVDAFRGHPSLSDLVAVAAGTGMRRGELLALQWPAVNFETGTISVVKSVEPTKRFGTRLTTPKTKRSIRSFQVDAGTLDVLRRVQERQKRIVAGVPDGVVVDLTLIKLPPGALCFPAVGSDLEAIRHPDSVTKGFLIWSREREFNMRFHDIRGGHATALIDAGVPVTVAAARLGHDPSMLLRRYAKRTAKTDAAAAAVIGGILKSILGTKST